ncbi:MAG: MMPL family transporter, partial [Novosphingobium sp.]
MEPAHDNPDLMAVERFEAVYGREDTLLFVIGARDKDLFTPERLAAINELTDAAWNLDDVKRVDSVTNFQRARAVGDDIQIDQLARSGDHLTYADARRLKREVAKEPILINRLLSADGRLGLVAVNFRFAAATASDQGTRAMASAQKLASQFAGRHPDLEVGLSGSVALDHAFVEASTFDSSVLLPLMVVVLLAIIMYVLRSPVGSFATFC